MKKKVFSVFLVFVAFLIFSSSYYSTPADNRIGYKAPRIDLNRGDTKISLQDFRGKYILVQFWASTDAKSRMSNIAYDRYAKVNDGIEFISLNYDPIGPVYNEIVKIDDLDTKFQYRDPEASNSKIFKTYKLDRGFHSLLVDRDGVIVAVNPSIEQISKLID